MLKVIPLSLKMTSQFTLKFKDPNKNLQHQLEKTKAKGEAVVVNSEFKKTTTTAATGTSLNKTFNEQNSNSWCISLPPSAKQQCEMTKFCVV